MRVAVCGVYIVHLASPSPPLHYVGWVIVNALIFELGQTALTIMALRHSLWLMLYNMARQ
jgi:hypothetical protein